MKFMTIVLAALLILGCASSTKKPDPDPGIVTPTDPIVSDNAVKCVHKYATNRTFVYVGQLKAYQAEMFGEIVVMFAFNLADGQTLVLSENQVVNYNCASI